MQYVLSISYGKDSLACLGAIEHLRWPLDRIVTADVWATDDIPAEYPPVVEFKAYVDDYIKRRYGIEVEHYCATRVDGVEKEKVTYSDCFYHVLQTGEFAGTIKGFPMQRGPWCQKLKLDATRQAEKMTYEKLFYHVRKRGNREGQIVGFPYMCAPECQKALKIAALQKVERELKRAGSEITQYLGIAADETARIAIHSKRKGVKLPLVELDWQEDYCGLWCKYSGLLSPTYETSTRDGCWFCHNQSVDQLRQLRKTYPDLWAILLRWDSDSPVTFKAPSGKKGSVGHTVHDFDRRFQLEDEGFLTPGDPRFKWAMLDQELNYRLF